MRRTIVRTCKIEETARVIQMRGIFDLQPSAESREEWEVDLPAVGPKGEPVDPSSGPWHIGLIVGPSGSGKSTAAREFFGDKVIQGFDWHPTRSVLDGFPEGMRIKDVTGLLSSVGFSSPPAWLRPFHVLSQGQQFRVTVARALAEMPDLAVIDEWTSVVDRTVAQIGSAAVAKAVRRSGKRLVAITCHYDVADWLQPDWILDMADGSFQWRSVQPRPSIELHIERCTTREWASFKKHHYLNTEINRGAQCFLGTVRGQPATFTAVIPFPMADGTASRREHRTVCLPDFQGVGIGNVASEAVAAMYIARGDRFFSTTSNPAMMRHRAKSPLWYMIAKPRMTTRNKTTRAGTARHQNFGKAGQDRLMASFEFVGPPDPRGFLE